MASTYIALDDNLVVTFLNFHTRLLTIYEGLQTRKR